MGILNKIIVTFIVLSSFYTFSYGQDKIVFLDLDKVVSDTIAGKSILGKLEKSKNDDNDFGLIGISGLKDFPIPLDENWTFIFENSNFELSFYDLPRENATPFGNREIVVNSNPVSNKIVWVIGDSFTNRLRPFLNKTSL